MDRLEMLQAFVVTAEAGSFAAAGRRLGKSRDSISKLIASLEGSLRFKLFARTTRTLLLTESGEGYLSHIKPIIDQLNRAQRMVMTGEIAFSGLVQVHAPSSFGLQVLAPLIGQYLVRQQNIAINLTLNDQPLERLPSEADIVIRISDAAPTNFNVRELGLIERSVFASPSYLKLHGSPRQPKDLSKHPCLHYTHLGERWQLFNGNVCERIEVSGRLACNTGLALAEAAAAGAGIAILPLFSAAPLEKQGRLVQILHKWRPAMLHIFALMPITRPIKKRELDFLDFLIACMTRYEWYRPSAA